MEIQDIIRPENKVYSKPELLEEVHMHYCPGCSTVLSTNSLPR